jgi:hypothetical protein
MATTTPNYGWTVPTSTDLVKDGATAIETLGDAIDASMNTALGTKKAGMVLLNTTSFSAVASHSLAANTFTSTYRYYRIVADVSGSTTTTFSLRFRASGVDKTTSYYGNSLQMIYTSTSSSSGGATNNGSGVQLPAVGAVRNLVTMDIANVNLTSRTLITNQGFGGDNFLFYNAHVLDDSVAYDSATFLPGSGTITGQYSVYGYNA